MRAKITCTHPSGEVFAIPSKSDAHRLLICASLADAPTEIVCNRLSQDIEATAGCVRSLGASVAYCGDTFTVTPAKRTEKAVLDCRESGSTLRFLLPVACALGGEYEILGSGRLPERPMGPLIDALRRRGANIEGDVSVPLVCRGGLSGGEFTIPGNISSQFISGLLFALPLLNEDSVIHIEGRCESLPYIRLTEAALSKFGISVDFDGADIYVKGRQKYHSPGRTKADGDWSNAAFWLALGAISPGAQIRCKGLFDGSIQGDRRVSEILRRFGAEVCECNGEVTVSHKCLYATEIDAADIPDLVPILSVVASVAEGESIISNISRLRIKESDRIASTSKMLTALGADISAEENRIVIRGKNKLCGGTVDSAGDHRIAMSAAIAASVCDGSIEITHAEAVAKSYPDFYEEYKLLGADIESTEE